MAQELYNGYGSCSEWAGKDTTLDPNILLDINKLSSMSASDRIKLVGSISSNFNSSSKTENAIVKALSAAIIITSTPQEIAEIVNAAVNFQLNMGSYYSNPELAKDFANVFTIYTAGKVSGGVNSASKGASEVKVSGNARKFWTNATEHNGVKVYQRNDIIDPSRLDKMGRTNIQRMEEGLAPIGTDGKSVNLHHMIQTNDSAIAEVTQSFHQQNTKVLHINPNTIPSGINRSQFNTWKESYWMNRAKDFK